MNTDEIYCDTAVFGPRRWRVGKGTQFLFSTREDAETALKLAGSIAFEHMEELADRVRQVLP